MKCTRIVSQYKSEMIGRLLVGTPVAPLSRHHSHFVLSKRVAYGGGQLDQARDSLGGRQTFAQNRFMSQKHQQQQKQQQQPQPRSQSFIGKLIDNLKHEYDKNREMKQSLEKFKQEAEKLEQSEALRSARVKYERFESETGDANRVLRERLTGLRDKLGEAVDEAQKLELIRKATELAQALNRQARDSAESVAQSGQKISQTAAFQNIRQTARAVGKELEDSTIGTPGVYRAPTVLRMRKDRSHSDAAAANVTADTSTTGLELHKDSKLFASWQNFKNNNAYVNKLFDWKMRYDESDNAVIRASRLLTEKVSDLMGGLFQRTEMSEVLTEICRVDPAFDMHHFLRQCERDIIPTVLEAMLRAQLDVLRDWCSEPAFRQLSQPLLAGQQLGHRQDNRLLDLDQLELVMAKMMDQCPVLVVRFVAQLILCVRDAGGAVVEGDPQTVWRVQYVWVLGRDQAELDPAAAWRLMDMSASSQQQMV